MLLLLIQTPVSTFLDGSSCFAARCRSLLAADPGTSARQSSKCYAGKGEALP